MTVEMIIVFMVALTALVLFVAERYSVDTVALAVPVILLVTGVIDADTAVAGLSNQATVTVGAMLVLTLGLMKTGAVSSLSEWATTARLGGPWLRLFILCVIVAVISPFLNNTPVVVVFLPVFLGLARHFDESPSRYLMPLSFAAMLGGTVTLIGTSTNLIVHGLAQSYGLTELSLFSIAPLGLAYTAVGLAYLFTVGRRLLPHRQERPDLSGRFGVRDFMTELQVGADSPIAETTLEELGWGSRYQVSVLGIQRGEREIAAPGAQRLIRAGDVLLVRGDTGRLFRLAREQKLTMRTERAVPEPQLGRPDAQLVELLVAPGSDLEGKTLEEAHFRQRHDAIVLATQRHGHAVHERLADVRFALGDILLVHGRASALDQLAAEPGFVPLGVVERPAAFRPRALVAVAIMAGVIGAAGTGLVPILPAALVGMGLMVFSRCVSLREVYAELDWSVLFLLAGLIPLGLAMEQTGAAAWVAESVARALGSSSPAVVVGAFYLVTSLLTAVMSNTATAVVLTPVAVVSAAQLGMNPYALLVAVMFGASASFITPVGYQTNTLIFGPGGYRFADFLRVGGPLNLLLGVTAALLIPLLWPS